MYSLEVLISTMFKETPQDIIDLLHAMNINSDCIVVNQCNKNKTEHINYKSYNVMVVYSTERGLSKSRNLAIRYARADVVIIADDDICYCDGYSAIILSAHEANPGADILTFKVKDGKKYSSVKKRLNFLTIHAAASNEISMKLKSIQEILFNERFGAGSPHFQCGEEIIFLKDCLKNKKIITFIPAKVGFFPEQKRASTWFGGFDKKYMESQGAVYYELSHLLCPLYIIQFALRKYKLYKNNLNVIKVSQFAGL